MRVSKLFGKTLRDDPSEAEIASHRLMLRAGLISQVASGVYSYLPLAWRSLRKIEQIIREEMDAAGGQELRLPVLQPVEIWETSGRSAVFGHDMFRVQDRRERPMVMAPTHEEVLTSHVKANVNSYRDLPLILYQIQTKFRDEPRPRGGLIRVREFDMKDAYSFDADDEGLDRSYQAMVRAYKRIYERCGLDTIMVEADSGAIGGKDSHEFIALAEVGEDTVVLCGSCGYAANVERAAFKKTPNPPEDPLPLEEVATPGIKTIEDLARYLDTPAWRTLKAVIYMADGEMVFVAIRGDLEVNEVKLKNALGGAELRFATPQEVEEAGLVPGSASPIGANARIVADDSLRLGSNFIMGSNKDGYHLRNANSPRDFEPDLVTDIALVQDGYACPTCDGVLSTSRGIEVGHVFKLDTRYSEAFGCTYPGQDDVQRPVVMGCYGIGVGRLLAATVEQTHDKAGMVLPEAVAPYAVRLAALNVEREDVAEAADALYNNLTEAGVEVLYDDRQESVGVKFNDAELLGLPILLVVSPRNITKDVVEVRRRAGGESTLVPRGVVSEYVQSLLTAR